MEILEYDEKKKVLAVKFNTQAVWKYSEVTKEMYEDVINSEFPEKSIKKIFHNPNIIGKVNEEM